MWFVPRRFVEPVRPLAVSEGGTDWQCRSAGEGGAAERIHVPRKGETCEVVSCDNVFVVCYNRLFLIALPQHICSRFAQTPANHAEEVSSFGLPKLNNTMPSSSSQAFDLQGFVEHMQDGRNLGGQAPH